MTAAPQPLKSVDSALQRQQVWVARKERRLRPWLYLLPALVMATVFIVYPALNTFYLSFRTADSSDWASVLCQANQPCWGILENYRYALTSPIMLTVFLNNLKWVLLLVSGTVFLGLLIASLANGIRYEAIARAIIFLPMAISFTGAGVIWKFMYNYGSGGQAQIGFLNGFVMAFGGQPVAWLTDTQVNTSALIIAGIWMWTGFCMTILAAAVKGVPQDLLEAARADGATEWQTFFNVTLPQIRPTLAVVITTMVINVLKIFDIVYVMTGGNNSTEVIANRMYIEQYTAYNTGRASAIAVVLILIISPVWVIIVGFLRDKTSEAQLPAVAKIHAEATNT